MDRRYIPHVVGKTTVVLVLYGLFIAEGGFCATLLAVKKGEIRKRH